MAIFEQVESDQLGSGLTPRAGGEIRTLAPSGRSLPIRAPLRGGTAVAPRDLVSRPSIARDGSGRALATASGSESPAQQTVEPARDLSEFEILADLFGAMFGGDSSSAPRETVVVGDAGYAPTSNSNALLIVLLLAAAGAGYYFLIYKKRRGE